MAAAQEVQRSTVSAVAGEATVAAGGGALAFPGTPLRRQVMISGEQLINAQQSYDPQNNQPVVSIRFDSGGSATFAKVTAQNVGKRFAMVLDGKVLSAPVIREPITGTP